MEGAVFGGRYYTEDYGAVMNYARAAPPEPKTNYVDIAGGNSAIDLTEAVGGVVYEDGSIEFKFTLFSYSEAEKMKNDLHGKRLTIVLDRDSLYYYDGRMSCTKIDQTGRIYEMYFTARVHPYKYAKSESIHTEELAGGTKDVLLANDRMPVMPRILVEGDILLTYGGAIYRMKSGEYQIPEVTLYEGLNRIRLSGTGKVKFAYREGRLA